MCGIVGVVGPEAQSWAEAVHREATRMHCRGPDFSGSFQDVGIVVAHRRLAILDLSPRSNQPLSSDSGQFVLTYNGEIYNFHDIDPRVDSDTLALLGEGLPARDPDRLRGMFAYALWDASERRLSLVRDRFGMKPLYYATSGANLFFGSTASSVARLIPRSTLSTPAIASFLRMGSVQGPETIFREVREVDPGCVLQWRNGVTSGGRYWGLDDAAGEPEHDLHTTLRNAVAAHSISDVPVVVFLSGGLDSAVVGALARESGVDVTALTLSFPELAIDETYDATITARDLGLKHEIVESENPLGHIDGYFAATDQPSIDGLNTYMISAAAAERGFHVALSGLGADELFGGYSTFRRVPSMEALNAVCPAPLAARLLRRTSGNMAKAVDLTHCGTDRVRIYEELRSVFSVADVASLLGVTWCIAESGNRGESRADNVTTLEVRTYLRNTLLRDADVFSMAHSLELRTPFVDHIVLRSALALKSPLRLVRGKRLVADALGTPRLRQLARMRKRGFSLPIGQWLRGPLQARVDDIGHGPLSTICDGAAVKSHHQQWRDGHGRDMQVWTLVVLDAWLRSHGPSHRGISE